MVLYLKRLLTRTVLCSSLLFVAFSLLFGGSTASASPMRWFDSEPELLSYENYEGDINEITLRMHECEMQTVGVVRLS